MSGLPTVINPGNSFSLAGDMARINTAARVASWLKKAFTKNNASDLASMVPIDRDDATPEDTTAWLVLADAIQEHGSEPMAVAVRAMAKAMQTVEWAWWWLEFDTITDPKQTLQTFANKPLA